MTRSVRDLGFAASANDQAERSEVLMIQKGQLADVMPRFKTGFGSQYHRPLCDGRALSRFHKHNS